MSIAAVTGQRSTNVDLAHVIVLTVSLHAEEAIVDVDGRLGALETGAALVAAHHVHVDLVHESTSRVNCWQREIVKINIGIMRRNRFIMLRSKVNQFFFRDEINRKLNHLS